MSFRFVPPVVIPIFFLVVLVVAYALYCAHLLSVDPYATLTRLFPLAFSPPPSQAKNFHFVPINEETRHRRSLYSPSQHRLISSSAETSFGRCLLRSPRGRSGRLRIGRADTGEAIATGSTVAPA